MIANRLLLHLLIAVLAAVVLRASSSSDRGMVRFADNQHAPVRPAAPPAKTAAAAAAVKSSSSPTKTKKKPSVPAQFEPKKKAPVKPSAAVSKKSPTKPIDDKYRNEFDEYMRQQIQQWQIAVVNGQPVSPPAGSQPPPGQPPSSVWIQVPANGYYPPPSYPYPPPGYPSYPPPAYPSYPPPSAYPPPAYPPPAYPPPAYPQQPPPPAYPQQPPQTAYPQQPPQTAYPQQPPQTAYPQQPLYPVQPAPASPDGPPAVESSSYAPSETPAGVVTPRPEDPSTSSAPEYPPTTAGPEYASTSSPDPGTPPPELTEPDIPEITQAPATDKPTELPEVIPAYPDTQQPEQPGIPLYPGQPAGGGEVPAQPPSTVQPTDAGSTDLYKPSSSESPAEPAEPATTYAPQQTTYAPDAEPPAATGPPPSTDALKAQCKEPRGQFPSESSCNKFINCWDETAVEQTCPAGLAFNPEKRYCDYPSNVDCGSRPVTVPPENVNSTRCPDGYGTYRSKENCGSFYVCVAGTPVDFVCPGGTNYNEDLKICDYPYRVDCKGLPSNPEPIETGTEIEQPVTTYAPDEPSGPPSTTASSSVPLTSAESSPVTEVMVAAMSTTAAAAPPVPVADPVAIYNYNLRKIPPSLVNTGVRCNHKSVYRLTPDCSSVTLCRAGFTHILNCGYATSYDIVGQKCMASQRANCGRSA